MNTIDLTQLQGLGGQAWLVSGTAALVLVHKYILTPFFKFFYNDFLKGYWKKRLELANEEREGVVGIVHALDLVEGKYHIFGRQLITIADSLSKSLKESELNTSIVLIDLKVQAKQSWQTTSTALNNYTSRDTKKKLSFHLEQLKDDEVSSFYKPIVVAIIEEKTNCGGKLRNVVLSQIDSMIAEATKIVLTKQK